MGMSRGRILGVACPGERVGLCDVAQMISEISIILHKVGSETTLPQLCPCNEHSKPAADVVVAKPVSTHGGV